MEKRSDISVSSSLDDEGRDVLRQRVEDEYEEECEDGEDDESNDVLLVLLPDEEDEGLHWVDKPGEAGCGTTGETRGDSVSTQIESTQGLKSFMALIKKLSTGYYSC